MNLYRSSSYSFVYKQAWGIFLFDKKKHFLFGYSWINNALWSQPSWFSDSHKNENDNPMSIYVLLRYNLVHYEKKQFFDFPIRSYVKTMLRSGDHLGFLIHTRVVKEHLRNISAKFVAKWFSGFRWK